MTNSLGSTDEPVVHVGYTRYREPMLELGVELYEVSGSRVKKNRRLNLFGSSLGRLHAKLAVVDKKTLFVGSMNLDPRSATINTELGAVIHSPAAGARDDPHHRRRPPAQRLQAAPEQGRHRVRMDQRRRRQRGDGADRGARLHRLAALQDLAAVSRWCPSRCCSAGPRRPAGVRFTERRRILFAHRAGRAAAPPSRVPCRDARRPAAAHAPADTRRTLPASCGRATAR